MLVVTTADCNDAKCLTKTARSSVPGFFYKFSSISGNNSKAPIKQKGRREAGLFNLVKYDLDHSAGGRARGSASAAGVTIAACRLPLAFVEDQLVAPGCNFADLDHRGTGACRDQAAHNDVLREGLTLSTPLAPHRQDLRDLRSFHLYES